VNEDLRVSNAMEGRAGFKKRMAGMPLRLLLAPMVFTSNLIGMQTSPKKSKSFVRQVLDCV